MSIVVFIDDFETEQQTLILLTDADLEFVAAQWNLTPPVAKVLLKAKLTDDKMLTWGEFKPMHYQLLLKKQLERYFQLSDVEQCNLDNSIVNTLRFLFCAYSRKILEFLGSNVDIFRIQRLGKTNFSMSVNTHLILETRKTKKKPALKIIVDNTGGKYD